MSLRLPLNQSILIPIVFESPLTAKRYPGKGEVLATLDTGYTGFALVPEDIYMKLGLDQLEPVRSKAKTADDREIELWGNYAIIKVPDIGLSKEGLVETTFNIVEVLLGVEWLKEASLIVDGCSQTVLVEACR